MLLLVDAVDQNGSSRSRGRHASGGPAFVLSCVLLAAATVEPPAMAFPSDNSSGAPALSPADCGGPPEPADTHGSSIGSGASPSALPADGVLVLLRPVRRATTPAIETFVCSPGHRERIERPPRLPS
jgi:hypothetical protein